MPFWIAVSLGVALVSLGVFGVIWHRARPARGTLGAAMILQGALLLLLALADGRRSSEVQALAGQAVALLAMGAVPGYYALSLFRRHERGDGGPDDAA